MSIGLIYLRPQKVWHVTAIGGYAASVPSAWSRLYRLIDRFGIPVGEDQEIGLAYDDPDRTAPHACRYDACLAAGSGVQPQPLPGLPVKVVPGGTYARARRSGAPNLFHEAVRSMHCSWLADKRLVLDRGRPIISIFCDSVRHTPEHSLRYELYLPVNS